MTERIARQIVNVQDGDTAGALWLLGHPTHMGASDGPAQRTLNLAVSDALRELGTEIMQETDVARRIGLVMQAYAANLA